MKQPITGRHCGRLVCVLALALSWTSFVPTVVAGALPHAQQIPEQRGKNQWAGLLGKIASSDGVAVGGVEVELVPAGLSMNQKASPAWHDRNQPSTHCSPQIHNPCAKTGADGIFRISGIVPGKYRVKLTLEGFPPTLLPGDIDLLAGQVKVVKEGLLRSRDEIIAAKASDTKLPEANPGEIQIAVEGFTELLRRPVAEIDALSRSKATFEERPNRWDPDLAPWGSMPPWDRYPHRPGEFPYASGHWWDPFNINRLKGDKPILGTQNTFFNFTGASTTAVDIRRLFVPSGVSAANSGSTQFFGRGGQAFVEETVRLSFDLFHGDTSFKPVDWRVRFTPAFNINQLWARERGIVNIDVREGTSRTDGHVGLQEAFVEKKIHDLSPNYDFISIRAGIQQFTSDFRGLLFSQEQPGVRVFGNLHSNRLQYNAAYFFFLEKDTNSGLNTLNSRHQQVSIANLYWQDFLFKGYTTQFSYHYNKDDATRHFDENGFLVRPAPIGNVNPHSIHAHYIGWTSNGHIGRINVSHSIYQALGHDSGNMFNFPGIKPSRAYINAQMAALELSMDRDWVRIHASGFFASGDTRARDGFERGFDAISESQSFAGGIFSFFNREGIRLTGTGVGLVAPNSFLPNLRSSKEEGQSNFINPGILLVNAGADFNLTTTLRAVTNVNYMRFNHTESLETLLFQSHIDQSIGTDYSIGVVYRPKLSENVVITSGVAGLTPGLGLRQIYTSKTLISGFTTVRFKF